MENYLVYFTGIGGQNTLLAAMVLAEPTLMALFTQAGLINDTKETD